MEKSLKPYIAKATRQARCSVSTARRSTGRAPGKDLAAVREWAKNNGHEVRDSGRISATLQQAYDAAH